MKENINNNFPKRVNALKGDILEVNTPDGNILEKESALRDIGVAIDNIADFAYLQPKGLKRFFDFSGYRKRITENMQIVKNSPELLSSSLQEDLLKEEACTIIGDMGYKYKYFSIYLTNTQNEVFVKTLDSIFHENLSQIENMITSFNPDHIKSSSYALKGFLNTFELIQRQKIKEDSIEKNQNNYFHSIKDILLMLKKNKENIFQNIKKAIQLADSDVSLFHAYNDILDVYDKFIPDTKSEIDSIFSSALDKNINIEKYIVKKVQERTLDRLVRKYFKTFGYSPDQAKYVMESWVLSSPKDKQEQLYSRNLQAMSELEKRLPGSPVILTEEFGICCFERYPIDILIKQVEEKDQQKPFGIVALAIYDHNGASTRDNMEDQTEQLIRKVEDQGVSAKIIEISSSIGLVKLLLKLSRKHNQKIKFLYLKTHGNKNIVAFGNRRKLQSASLTSRQITTEVLKKVRKLFDDDAQIVLSSCFTGYKNGLAETLAHDMGIEVVAPNDKTAGFQTLNVEKNGESVKFDIDFRGADNEKVKTNIY